MLCEEARMGKGTKRAGRSECERAIVDAGAEATDVAETALEWLRLVGRPRPSSVSKDRSADDRMSST